MARLRRLHAHLAPPERNGTVDRWVHTRIAPGKRCQEEIARAVSAAEVAVLLVSPLLMTSTFIARNESPLLVDADARDGTVVLPVILRPCLLRDRNRIQVKMVESITTAINT